MRESIQCRKMMETIAICISKALLTSNASTRGTCVTATCFNLVTRWLTQILFHLHHHFQNLLPPPSTMCSILNPTHVLTSLSKKFIHKPLQITYIQGGLMILVNKQEQMVSYKACNSLSTRRLKYSKFSVALMYILTEI